MKKLIAFILTLAMILSLCACGGAESEKTDKGSSNSSVNSLIKSDDDPVDIYLAIKDFEEKGAEAYIETLKESNPENEYRYYNEEYYIQVMTEGERKAMLEELKNIDKYLGEEFASEFDGLFIKGELNKAMNELTFHFNKEAYESDPFASFSFLIIGSAYLDSVQAYNLISPEKRSGRLIFVDENGEILMDSNEIETSSEVNKDSDIAKASYNLKDYVVIDDENCTFIIKDIDANGDWGFTLNVFCENKTDNPLMFSWDKVSVMGYMIDPFWGSEVAANKKANSTITFSYDAFNEIGIESIDDIVFTLRVFNSEDWTADAIIDEEFSIYPTGKSIQDIKYPERKIKAEEEILYDTDEYSVIILSNEVQDDSFILKYYLENKTGHEISFSMDEVSVNGYMADPFWGTTVAAGKKMYTSTWFYKEMLEENDISDVEEIAFKLRVSNAENWDVHAEEAFTYIP